MPVDPLLADLFVDTVSIEPFEGYVGGAVRKFGGPVLFSPAAGNGVKVTKEEKLLIIPGAEPRMSAAKVRFQDTQDIDSRSRITIPSIGVNQQDIAFVQQFSGTVFDGGPNHHTVVRV